MNQTILIKHPTGVLENNIQLPASKSEANRALIIAALSGQKAVLHNLSEANDTQLLQRLLKSDAKEINAEDAGTVMRFLTAYYAVTGQNRTLTGTDRMCQRPIKVLVDALRELGADIEYLKEEGYPPLHIKSFNSKGVDKLSVRSDISSQYISALVMIAPYLPNGLELTLEGKIGSRPYIEMTRSLMKHFGVESQFEGNKIKVPAQMYKTEEFHVESDWSASSYWYSMVALAREATVSLLGLKEESFQGDRAIVGIMSQLGVHTSFNSNGVVLTKKRTQKHLTYDFTDCPDLAQSIVALCAGLGVTLELTGLESLRIKETDRIHALQIELLEMGSKLEEVSAGVFKLEPGLITKKELHFRTYEDHRMAMAFAPLALLTPVSIQDPHVVRKSYPSFWQDLKKVGFDIVDTEE